MSRASAALIRRDCRIASCIFSACILHHQLRAKLIDSRTLAWQHQTIGCCTAPAPLPTPLRSVRTSQTGWPHFIACLCVCVCVWLCLACVCTQIVQRERAKLVVASIELQLRVPRQLKGDWGGVVAGIKIEWLWKLMHRLILFNCSTTTTTPRRHTHTLRDGG